MYGVINLDKPAGMTSRDCVNQIQGLVRPHKCGHAGTLDPMATGVLLVCVGPATRLTDLLHQSTKTYSAEFLLGISADTDDVSGDLSIGTDSGALPTETDVRAALSNFTGTIMQIPPAYSAVHVQGERAYRMARKGIAPQIQPREVYVQSIDMQGAEILDGRAFDERLSGRPLLQIKVEITCGSGTYIRSIARDLGAHFQCGGLMSALRRTRIGTFDVQSAVSPEELDQETVAMHVTSALSIVEQLPQYCCSPRDHADLSCGRQVRFTEERFHRRGNASCKDDRSFPDGDEQQWIAMVAGDPAELIALASRTEDGTSLRAGIVLRRIQDR